MFGLYIHIPFCKHICHYCNFYKMVVSDKLKEKTINYIIRELKIQEKIVKNSDTIYIGGGTPSILPLNLLEMLLKTLLGAVEIKKVKEFSIEANPEDLTEDFIKLISKYKVNRVSIGVQSFQKNIIDTLGRKPYITKDELIDKINLLNKYGITNISVDLMYAVPGETLDDLKKDLDVISHLPITHVSTYSFILEDKTILKYKYENDELDLVDEDLDRTMYDYIREKLEQNDFIHYETSNFAKDGFMGIHNLSCWHNEEYLGIGPAAASNYRSMRFCNLNNLNSYFECIDNLEYKYEYFEMLTKDDKMYYELLLGLRLIKGVNIDEFISKYNVHPFDVFTNGKKLLDDGMIQIKDNYLSISKEYIYLANLVLRKLLYND